MTEILMIALALAAPYAIRAVWNRAMNDATNIAVLAAILGAAARRPTTHRDIPRSR